MKDKKLTALTSLIILLPCAVGIALWGRLPETMPTHWGLNGQPDGWSGKGFAVFGIPAMLLVFQWICIWVTRLDTQNQSGGNRKVLELIMYLFPALSVLCGGAMYAGALGCRADIGRLILVFTGLVFTVVGNYLPKCRQNSTLGIKLPWTLRSEENWNRTHRVGGITWVICGLGQMVCGMVGWYYALVLAMIPMVAVPTVYSWLLYRRQNSK